MHLYYLDCHKTGVCCHLVIHIENLLRQLQQFYFSLWPVTYVLTLSRNSLLFQVYSSSPRHGSHNFEILCSLLRSRARVTTLGKIIESNEVKILEVVSPRNVTVKYFDVCSIDKVRWTSLWQWNMYTANCNWTLSWSTKMNCIFIHAHRNFHLILETRIANGYSNHHFHATMFLADTERNTAFFTIHNSCDVNLLKWKQGNVKLKPL
jgi:hypothetical protein